MAREELRSKRPFKIWDSWRNVRKGLVVSNFEELIHRGKEKLGVPQNENVCLVLESDGTQVEDGEYFKTLANNTILLLLRHGERWCPTGVDIIRAAISAIPKIVCETIHALELHDETPSWKIMDNKGRVTVVLHWDQRSSGSSSSSGQQQQQHHHHHQQQQQQQQQQQAQQHSQQQQQAQQQQHVPQPQHQAKVLQDVLGGGSKYSPTKSKVDAGGFFLSGGGAGGVGGVARPSLVIQTSLDKLNYGIVKTGVGHGVTSEIVCPPRYSSPQITVINHDDMVQKSFTSPINSSYGPIVASGPVIQGGVSGAIGSGATVLGGIPAHQQTSSSSSSSHAGMTGRLVKQGTNSFESTTIHIHTPECSNHIHQPVARNGSPVNGTDGGNAAECDFHCCALHEEGRRIAVHKSVATSPIQDSQHQHHSQHQQQQTQTQTPSPQPPSSLSDGTRRSGMVKGHVRFRDTADEESSPRSMPGAAGAAGGAAGNFHLHHHHHHNHHQDHDSSESETENTIMEDEIVTSEKFLLLIDQLTVDQKHHLSIKDIGIILERLSSKILDVERLDRESESEECYNWTIKAIIRGDVLRELGVIYNGNYYAISEHPGYKEESEENNEDNEEEEEDRL